MHLRWTELAADDLTNISDYIEGRDGPAAARRVALALYQGVDALLQFPTMRPLAGRAERRDN